LKQTNVTSTTSFAKMRGFTVELLFCLKNNELRVMDLVDLTGKYSQYVYSYLRNMRNYGLVEKKGVFWKLTEKGASFLSYLESLNNNILKIRKNKESYDPKRLKQVSFTLWLQNSSLHDAEKEVVEVLMDHYKRTGSKFLYFRDIYDMAERFKIPPDKVNKVLMNLKQDHIVYNFRDRTHNAWKIGLYKAFIEKLKITRRAD